MLDIKRVVSPFVIFLIAANYETTGEFKGIEPLLQISQNQPQHYINQETECVGYICEILKSIVK